MTAELALALPALLFVLAAAVTVQSVLAARAGCADAARAGARAAARGEPDSVVRDVARRSSSRVFDVRIDRRDGLVRVEAVAHPAAVVARIPVPAVTATAVASDEQP